MKFSNELLFGAVYLLGPEDERAGVERDVRNMSELGFNLLTLWPTANSWLAPDTGDFVFDDTLHFLDVCQSHGMKVILQLTGQNPTQEFAPDCLIEDAHLIRSSPHNIYIDYNHPEVRAMVLRYFDVCVGALKHHPAVFGWDVFNETNFRNEGMHSTARYREWLKERYAKIGNLNEKWGRRHSGFEQIDPVRRLMCYSAWSSLLPAVEYETFQAANLTEICREWCAHIRQLDPDHPVLIDGTSAQLLQPSLTERNTDEFEIAKDCDIYGGTFYPKSWGMAMGERPWQLMLYYGISRAAAQRAGKPFFINELQTHTQSLLTPGSEISPGELRLFVWAALAAGGEAIQLWRWSPFLKGCQSTGRGLTALDGTPGPRAVEAGAILARLRRHAPDLQGARPVSPDVRILLGYRSRLFYDALHYWAPSSHPDAVSGWHRLFTRLGLAVEAGSVEHLDDTWLGTPVIVLPAMISLSGEQVAWLEKYTCGGGCLVADARLNAIDEWGQVRREGSPGHPLSQVFGVAEVDVGPGASCEWDGVEWQASHFTQTLRVFPGARVLARDSAGRAMVVANAFGSGKGVYFASMAALDWSKALPEGLPKLVGDSLALPARHFVEKPESVIVRWHEGAGREIAYVLNFAKSEARIRFAPRLGGCARELVTDTPLPTDELVVPPQEIRLVAWENPK